VTTPPGKPDASDAVFHGAATARLWGTAHITLAALLAAALAWCAARLPGNIYDVDPLPVSPNGWYLWGCGLLYLASIVAVHVRLGVALRRATAIYRREWVLLVVFNTLVTAVAAYCMFRGHASHTHAFGLENHTASICTAAGLSTLLIVATGVRWRDNLVPGTKLPAGILTVLTLNMFFAISTSYFLIRIELTPV
jgi:hypothetical protein